MKRLTSKIRTIILLTFLLSLCSCASLPGTEASEESVNHKSFIFTDETILTEEYQESVENTDQVEKESQIVVNESQDGRYCYDHLSEDEKTWYRDIYGILSSEGTDVMLSKEQNETVGEDGIGKVFECVLNDHPELIYVGGYSYTLHTYGDELEKITFSGTYNLEHEEITDRMNQIDAAVNECLSHINMDASDYEKVKYVYEYIITNTEYVAEASDNQNMYSVFIGKKSVCQGYAKATQYLLNKLGVKTTLVIGEANGEGHAWNLVQADGSYYFVDTTWGDPSYLGDGVSETGVHTLPEISYDYLLVDSRELLRTHTINHEVPIPECTAMEDNYYVKEGAYFSSFDENGVANFFGKGYEEDKTSITLKCSDSVVYNTFYQELITNQRIFDFMNNPDGTAAYVESPENLTLTFWLVNE